MPTVHAFCPSCGGNVACDVKVEGTQKRVVCRGCHFVVEERRVAASAAEPAPAARGRTGPGTVLSAEDDVMLRTMLQDVLVERGLAKNVVAVANGFEALVAFHKATQASAPIDLIMLDVNMPILDGINAALCIRAAEKAAGGAKHPLLFFTSNLIDERFRRALEYLSPARYINKGAAGSGPDLGDRLVAVVRSLVG